MTSLTATPSRLTTKAGQLIGSEEKPDGDQLSMEKCHRISIPFDMRKKASRDLDAGQAATHTSGRPSESSENELDEILRLQLHFMCLRGNLLQAKHH